MTLIPKIVHFVWVGPKPFGSQENVDKWQAILPDYNFMMWNEENIDFSYPFIKSAYACSGYNRVSNYARLFALKKFGGIYMDHDVELFKSFDSLLDKSCFIGFQTNDPEQSHIVNNAVIGALPDHPFINRALSEMDALDGGKDVGANTGPGLFSKILRQECCLAPADSPVQCGTVSVMPTRYFYPYEWNKPFSPDCIATDTIAVHHWDHSWKRPKSLIDKIRRRLSRLFVKLAPDIAFYFAKAGNVRARAKAITIT